MISHILYNKSRIKIVALILVMCSSCVYNPTKEIHPSKKQHTTINNQLNVICTSYLPNCIPLVDLIENLNRHKVISHESFGYEVILDDTLNFSAIEKISNKHKLSKRQQRHLVQVAALQLNQISFTEFYNSTFAKKSSTSKNLLSDPRRKFEIKNIKKIKLIALNNTAIIYIEPNLNNINSVSIKKPGLIEHSIGQHPRVVQSSLRRQLTTFKFNDNDKIKLNSISSLKKTFQTVSNVTTKTGNINIGIIDSGVSKNHQDLVSLNIQQYNPQNETDDIVDSGLGHGSGVLGMLDSSLQMYFQSVKPPTIEYFSCNALPAGQHQFLLTIQCLNWLFLQDDIDVIVNAWLASEPGCQFEWLYPLQTLWHAQTILVFAAGNYGMSENMNYSPVNLAPLMDDLPMLSVGAINQQGKRLPSSSFGISQCGSNQPQVNLAALGEGLRVPNPLNFDTYQLVSGTSFAAPQVAAAVAKLKYQFLTRSNRAIVSALINSVATNHSDNIAKTGNFSQFNFQKAQRLLQ